MLYNEASPIRLRSWSKYMTYAVFLTAALLLSGWLIDKEHFKEVLSVNNITDPLSCLLFMFSAIAFLLLNKTTYKFHIAGYLLTALLMLIAFFKVMDTSSNIGINTQAFSFKHFFQTENDLFLSGKMMKGAAISFLLTGLFLAGMHIKIRKEQVLGYFFAIPALMVAIFSMICWLYNVDDFYGAYNYFLMPVQSAFCFLLLSVSFLFAYPNSGLMRMLTGKSPGSVIARRLIPAAISIPTIIGFFRIEAYLAELFTIEFGEALFILGIIVIFISIIWYNARLLNASDTEKEKIEETLRYNNILLQNITDPIISTDASYNIRSWNKHAEHLYGWKEEEVLGKPIVAVLQIQYPYVQDTEILNAFVENGHWSGEVTHQNRNGDTLYINASSAMVKDLAGSWQGIVNVMRDITQSKKAAQELKESELRLKNIIDSYTGLIYAKDRDGKIMIWNKTCEKATHKSLEEVLGKKVQDLFPGELSERTLEKDREVFATGAAIHYEEQLDLDGVRTYYSVSLFPLINLRGEMYGICGISMDISSRKQLEQNLLSFNEQLEKEVAARTKQLRELTAYINNVREEERINIAREIHDELGQQLTVLKMDVSWLNKKLSAQDIIVQERIQQIITFINEAIVTVRKIASQLRPGILDDLGLIAAIEWQLSELKKRTGIKVVFLHDDIPEQLPEVVKTGMFRILQECLTNVARHANATQVIAEINYDENKHLVLKIQDDGQGFDSLTKTKKTLGLLGMEERAIVMGGKYIISSTPGMGTTILIDVEV